MTRQSHHLEEQGSCSRGTVTDPIVVDGFEGIEHLVAELHVVEEVIRNNVKKPAA